VNRAGAERRVQAICTITRGSMFTLPHVCVRVPLT
jgi:hypothetical protein